MRTGHRIGFLAALLGCFFSTTSQGFNPEWQWKVVGYGPAFTTKQAALDHLHARGSPYHLLTRERALTHISDTSERYEYEAPKLAPTPRAWRYFDGVLANPTYISTEEEWFTRRLATVQSDSRCPAKSMFPTSGWVVDHRGWGGLPDYEHRSYERHYYSYVKSKSTCNEIIDRPVVYRDRSMTCPSPYGGISSPPGCRVKTTAIIEGRRSYCETGGSDSGTRGNPCNAVTGDKSETETDYVGPDGLTFVRHYHSRSLDATGGIGAGWTHNYQVFLTPDVNGVQYGLARPNGYRESLHKVSSSHYVSKAASGSQVKKISTTLWRVLLGDGSSEDYDANGRLNQIRNANGRITTLTYTSGRLTSVTGPFGHRLVLEYDANSMLSRLVLPDGEAVAYTYVSGNLTQVLYPDGRSRLYHYEDASFPSHLTGITDENGVRYASFSYDSSARALTTEHAGGVERYTFAYNSNNSVVTDGNGTVETIQFTTDTSLGRRVKQVSKAGVTRTYTVPSSGTDYQRRITQKTDGRGTITAYTYNDYHVMSMTEAYGTSLARTTTYQYLNDDSDLPTLVTEPNRTTSFTYDATNNVLTRTITDTSVSNASRTWTYTYDSQGRVLTEDGPRTDVSDVTTYAYYTCTTAVQCGRLQSVTDAVGHVTTFLSYDAHGQPLTVSDANGVVTTLTYDLRQRLTSRTTGGETSTFEYWPTGLLKKSLLPDGSFALYTYDDAHRLIRIEDGEGNRVEYTLDAMSNRTAENVYDPSNALVRTRAQVFNALNELWKQIGAAGTAAVTTTFGYDGNSNQTSAFAPLGRTTAQSYDQLDRLKEITDPGSGVTLFGYDAQHNLTSVTDPRGKVTSYEYNGFGDLTKQVSPDTGTTTHTYDAVGNLATTTDARTKVGEFAYDALNRVTSIAYPGRAITLTYDAGTHGLGRLTGASSADHSLAWSYDAQGRVTGKGQTVGAVTKSVGYGYTNGNLTSLITPSGQTITYAYANGRIAGVTLNGSTTILDGVLYEPFGPISGWTWGNGTIAARAYDLDGNFTNIDSAGAYAYSYDDAFRITGITDMGEITRTWSYGYDVMDRLNTASRTGETIGYTYDANGNRLTQTGVSPATYTISPSSNRVTSIVGTPTRTYSYDAAGNTTRYSELAFAYSDAGRMTSVTNAGVTTTYVINALGQRVQKANPSTTLHFVYDESGHLLGEYDATGALVQETIWLDDVPVATLRPNGAGDVNVYYIHTDHLNTPRRIARPSDSAILWRWDSDPFGATAAHEDPDGDAVAFTYNLRFPGQYFDAESGLHYNYFRDYDPVTGRYVQSDPIGLDGGVGTYSYAAGDPVSNLDPTGESPLAPVLAVGSVALRICQRIPRCAMQLATLTATAIKLCKNVVCEVRFDKKGHPFPTSTGRMELCMHYQIDCHIKGVKGSGFSIHSRLPICWKPGEAFPTVRPPSWLP